MTTITDDQLFAYSDRVKEKVVLVTGAANGIGKETALEFAKWGAKLVIGDLDATAAERVVAEIKQAGGQAISKPCNVFIWENQVDLFDHAVKEYGAVDIVIANAGVTEIGNFDSLLIENGRPIKPNLKTLEINLISVLYTANLALHYLKQNQARDGKAIVFLGSMASWQAIPGAPLYSASKHGVLGTMRSLHKICLPDGIRVGAIHPWFAATGILSTAPRLLLAGIPMTPVKRVAGAIFYAASDPDMETSGCAWLLPDDGPVFRINKEEFKEGVYGMIDARSKRIFQAVGAAKQTSRILRDLWLIFGKQVIIAVTIGFIAAAFRWWKM